MTLARSAASLSGVRRVRVGSLNPPKLDAVRAAIEPFAPDALVVGVEVASGVPEQPLGFAEIAAGARSRAAAALAAGPGGDPALGVGIEDGLVSIPELGGEPLNVGCAVVTDGVAIGLGFSAGFAYPPAVSEPAVRERRPIGALFDELWAARRGEVSGDGSGSGIGNIGKLTGGILTRAEYARHAVVCALVRFLHRDLYPTESAG